MDKVKAKILEGALRGKLIRDWKVDRLINHGKSAAVFLAYQGTEPVALKIFDDELIERYGDQTQRERIKRELELVGHSHPHMVKILGGGFDDITNNHYLVMQYLEGPNLKECLGDVPAENIANLIYQLASAARFLEDLELVHRDIKPENIILLNNLSHLMLLDFGVVRPIGKPGLTDDDGIQTFVGTLQYSSPEFLLRKEEDNKLGWRALTFYQIGGVLHDLIMRRPLFEEFANPYARLVNAVQYEVPVIQNSAVPSYLTELAGICLLKDPKLRVKLVDWSRFEIPAQNSPTGESAKQRVTNRSLLIQARESDKVVSANDIAQNGHEVVSQVVDYIKEAIRSIRNDNNIFPPVTVVHEEKNSCVKIAFRKSDSHGLPFGLSINVYVDILDAPARVISLSAVAFLSSKPGDNDTPAQFVFFEGIYDGAAIYSALEGCVYEAIEVAQNTCLSDESNQEGSWIIFRGTRG